MAMTAPGCYGNSDLDKNYLIWNYNLEFKKLDLLGYLMHCCILYSNRGGVATGKSDRVPLSHLKCLKYLKVLLR